MNKFSTELLIVAAAIVIFYLRIAMLRGQKKRYEREYALKRRKVKGRSKGTPLPKQAPGSPPFGISSWVLVVVAILVMLIGLVAYNKFMLLGWEIVKDPVWVDTYSKYWHWLVSAGVVMFAFCFKINKPIEEE